MNSVVDTTATPRMAKFPRKSAQDETPGAAAGEQDPRGNTYGRASPRSRRALGWLTSPLHHVVWYSSRQQRGDVLADHRRAVRALIPRSTAPAIRVGVRYRKSGPPTGIQPGKAEYECVDRDAERRHINKEQRIEVRAKRVRCVSVGEVADAAEPDQERPYRTPSGRDKSDEHPRHHDDGRHEILPASLRYPGGGVPVDRWRQQSRG